MSDGEFLQWCQFGEFKKLEKFLETNAVKNAIDQELQMNGLDIAYLHRKIDCIDLLISKGAKFSKRMFHNGIMTGDLFIVDKFLFDYHDANLDDINFIDFNGGARQHVLFFAAHTGNEGIVERLLLDKRIIVEESHISLGLAIVEGFVDIAKIFLECDRVNPFKENFDCLVIAINENHLTIARMLFMHKNFDLKRFLYIDHENSGEEEIASPFDAIKTVFSRKLSQYNSVFPLEEVVFLENVLAEIDYMHETDIACMFTAAAIKTINQIQTICSRERKKIMDRSRVIADQKFEKKTNLSQDIQINILNLADLDPEAVYEQMKNDKIHESLCQNCGNPPPNYRKKQKITDDKKTNPS
jgi:hypothetical protein